MARFTFEADTVRAEGLEQLGRPMIRRIVEAGADAAIEHMRGRIESMHTQTGEMAGSVGKAEYVETLGGGSQLVYPLDSDRKGVRNALKAYVINYGRGGTRKKGKMGDHFIDRDPDAERVVIEAMERESERAMTEIGAT